jgi:hypothetical protein
MEISWKTRFKITIQAAVSVWRSCFVFCLSGISHLFTNDDDVAYLGWADVVDPEEAFVKDDSITFEVHIIADSKKQTKCSDPNVVITAPTQTNSSVFFF